MVELSSIDGMTATATGSAIRPWVGSETGRLRAVLLHRPGGELERITPGNMRQLLFDDIPWAARAQADHDVLASAFRTRGVTVLYLQDLLGHALEDLAVRSNVIDRTLHAVRSGTVLEPILREWFAALGSEELARRLICGVSVDELPDVNRRSLAGRIGLGHGFVLAPLPNHLYTRDSCAWIRDRAGVTRMACDARRREAIHLEAVIDHHPWMLAPGWEGAVPSREVEGGDLLVVRPNLLLVGVGARTSAAAVDDLAQRSFADGIEEVVAFQLPLARETMHLDTLLTFVDRDAIVAHPRLEELVTPWRIRPSRFGPRVEEAVGATATLQRALDLPLRRLGSPASRDGSADRDQWNDAHNLMALGPGAVIAYDRNERMNAALAQAGIEVVSVPGGELGRGRGGPRCLSCPIWRDDD
jgi:arginine deiminase